MANEIIDDRHIRVFISSTFQDMEKEREQLIKKVFPILRRKAAERGVVVTELDLRWGITKEESENGKVLEICLNEIDRSRPFFIGLLGDRYGWCPTEDELKKNHNIEELHPWVRQAVKEGKSVTEMEFLYGALSPALFQDKHIDAYFWIKKSDATNDKRLENLKQTVRSNIAYPCNDYATPEDLGEQVTTAFEKILEERYPPQRLSEVETFKLDQQFYRRRLNDLYIPIQENLYNLDRFLDDDNNRVMVLTGEPGSGKSATVSNWLQTRQKDTSCQFLSCFLQASNKGAGIENVLDYMNSELLTLLRREQEDNLLGNNDKAEEEFKTLLMEASSLYNLVLVVDGVNVLDNNDAKLLNWLPSTPKGCKVVLTTTEDDATFQAATRKGFEIIQIALMIEPKTKLSFIKEYLCRYGKSLTDIQSSKLTASPVSKVPGYLKSILNELKSNGGFDELDKTIDAYSAATNAIELYGQFLSDYETSFGTEFVANILLPITVSRDGLDETTIMAIANASPLHWSQFYCAISDLLSNHRGLISVENNNLKNLVLQKYHNGIKWARCSILANIDLDSDTLDSVLEFAYQWWKMPDYKELNKIIASGSNLTRLYLFDQNYLYNYWDDIRDSGQSLFGYYLNISNLNCGAYAFMGLFMHKVGQYRLSIFYCLQELIRNMFRTKAKKIEEDRMEVLHYNMMAMQYYGESLGKLRKYRFARWVMKRLQVLSSKHTEVWSSDYFKNVSEVSLANWNILSGKGERAAEDYDKIINAIDSKNEGNGHEDSLVNIEKKAVVLVNAVATYLHTDEKKAVGCFLDADNILGKAVKDYPSLANLYIPLLLMAPTVFSTDTSKSKEFLERALIVAEATDLAGSPVSDKHMARLYVALALTICESEREKASDYCDRALSKYADKITDRCVLSVVLLECCQVFANIGNNDKAKSILVRLQELPPDFTTVTDNNHCWGMYYYFWGFFNFTDNPDLSAQYFRKSISQFVQNGGVSWSNLYLGFANENLGRLLYTKGDYKAAVEKLRSAIQIYKKILAQSEDTNVLCQLVQASYIHCYTHLCLHNTVTAYERAKENLQRVEKVPREHPLYYQLKMNTHAVMSDILSYKGANVRAKRHLQLAIDFARKGNESQDVIEKFENALNNM